MREKYESLALSELREIAKARGLKGISALKKADLIEHMLEADEDSALTCQGKLAMMRFGRWRTEGVPARKTAAGRRREAGGVSHRAGQRADGKRNFGGYGGRLWLYPKRKLSAG